MMPLTWLAAQMWQQLAAESGSECSMYRYTMLKSTPFTGLLLHNPPGMGSASCFVLLPWRQECNPNDENVYTMHACPDPTISMQSKTNLGREIEV